MDLDESPRRTVASLPWGESEKNVDRVAAFSDGVFAIAITLLVLQFEPPPFDEDVSALVLWQYLVGQGTSFFSYVLSFVVLGTFWLGHHRMFHYIRRVDSPLLWLNLLILLFCGFLPYPTELLGKYAPNQAAVMIYAATIGATGLAWSATWFYATRVGNLIDPELSPANIRATSLRVLAIPVIFLSSLVIAVFNPTAAMYSWIAFWLLTRLVRTPREPARRPLAP